MNRKRGFIIALASAAATFGILFATVGKPPYTHHCHKEQSCHHSPDHRHHP